MIEAVRSGFKAEVQRLGVSAADIVEIQVGGAYELPFSVKRMIELHNVDVVCPIGCLIKGETAHFEYIAEAVTQGLMRVSLDSGVPVLFGVLTVFNADQARARAGIGDGSKHNHGIEWAQTAVEQGVLKKQVPTPAL